MQNLQYMKNILFSILFLSATTIIAQNNQFDSNGKRHGLWKKSFKNGRIRYQGKFNHGKEVGTFKFYSAKSSDHPIIIRTFNTNDNTAVTKFYTTDGKLESEGTMQGKKRIGKWIYYHKDGKTIMLEENYVDGKLHGSYKTFYPNKKPTIIANYKNGLLHGNFKRYAIKGYLYQDLNYKNGKLDGEATYFDRKTGKIIKTGKLVDDEKVGVWKYYVDGVMIEAKEIVKPKIKDRK